MDYLEQHFSVPFSYKVHFTHQLFHSTNNLLGSFLQQKLVEGATQKILFVIDQGVADAHPDLWQNIRLYFNHYTEVVLVNECILILGGEEAKNNQTIFDTLMQAVDTHAIDRHSYIAAIGGGAVLDLAGFVAAIAHRGIRHIRIPTTVLSQNDSGVGVKNGINYFSKKNFLGSFAPPVAVFNDDAFLPSLSERNWRSGIAEAIKVALIKDADFFNWMEANTNALVERNREVMNTLIKRCAALHLEHIAGGDPFELGSSRPLDFGHWSAHKLEQLTGFELLHGEAVAMGIALDTLYSVYTTGFAEADAQRVITVLHKLGFAITHPLMQVNGPDSPLLKGLQEFREHLGGRLTIMLLSSIGHGIEVHEIDTHYLQQAGERLKAYQPIT